MPRRVPEALAIEALSLLPRGEGGRAKRGRMRARAWLFRRLFANFAFSALITFGGAKAEASPPIEAICRTKVAVIGLTGEDAGRKTVRSSGAIAPFMPAICIS